MKPARFSQAAYEGETPTATWHTIVHAYLRTKETLAFDDTTRDIALPAGEYGFLARHALEPGETHETVGFQHGLTAKGDSDLKEVGGGFYTMSIGPEEKVVLVNRLITVKVDRPRDGDDQTGEEPCDRPGKDRPDGDPEPPR